MNEEEEVIPNGITSSIWCARHGHKRIVYGQGGERTQVGLTGWLLLDWIILYEAIIRPLQRRVHIQSLK